MDSRILRITGTILIINILFVSCYTKSISNDNINGNSINEIENYELDIKDNMIVDKTQKDEFKVIKGVIYYVLIDEYLKNNDPLNPNISVLIRDYYCYDGIKNNIYLNRVSVALEEVDSIDKAKELLGNSNQDGLKLRNNTIVSSYVKSNWETENYNAEFEYHEKSPKNLVFEDLKPIE